MDAASDASHPIPVGETVTVLRMRSAADPFIEGRAVVRDRARGPHSYRVRFIGDPVLRVRVIHPDNGSGPERVLEILRDLWRACNTPAVAEFFPEENN
jgi:hypothetical protein